MGTWGGRGASDWLAPGSPDQPPSSRCFAHVLAHGLWAPCATSGRFLSPLHSPTLPILSPSLFHQLELIGHSVFDFIHPCDQEELQDVLSPRQGESLHHFLPRKPPLQTPPPTLPFPKTRHTHFHHPYK